MPYRGILTDAEVNTIVLTSNSEDLKYENADVGEAIEVIVKDKSQGFQLRGKGSQNYRLDTSTLPKVYGTVLPRPLNIHTRTIFKEYDGTTDVDKTYLRYVFKDTGESASGLIWGSSNVSYSMSIYDVSVVSGGSGYSKDDMYLLNMDYTNPENDYFSDIRIHIKNVDDNGSVTDVGTTGGACYEMAYTHDDIMPPQHYIFKIIDYPDSSIEDAVFAQAKRNLFDIPDFINFYTPYWYYSTEYKYHDEVGEECLKVYGNINKAGRALYYMENKFKENTAYTFSLDCYDVFASNGIYGMTVSFKYTDGTIDSIIITSLRKNEEWVHHSVTSNSNKTIRGIGLSYGTGDAYSYLKNIQLRDISNEAANRHSDLTKINNLSNSRGTGLILKVHGYIYERNQEDWWPNSTTPSGQYFTDSDFGKIELRTDVAYSSPEVSYSAQPLKFENSEVVNAIENDKECNYKLNKIYGYGYIYPRTAYATVSVESKVYDGNQNIPYTVSLHNIVEGDDVTLSNNVAVQLESKNASENATVDILNNAVLSGSDSSNYVVNTAIEESSSTIVVSKRPISLIINRLKIILNSAQYQIQYELQNTISGDDIGINLSECKIQLSEGCVSNIFTSNDSISKDAIEGVYDDSGELSSICLHIDNSNESVFISKGQSVTISGFKLKGDDKDNYTLTNDTVNNVSLEF